jgi:hypothetical protein
MPKFTRKQWLTLALVFVLLLTGVGLRFFREHARMERLRKLRDEAFSPAALQASPAERREKMEAFRKEQEKLSPAERKEIWADRRKEREKELERYHKMSKEEKAAFLDERIDQMEAMRASRQRMNGGSGQTPPQGGTTTENRGGWANLSQEDRERRRKEMLDSTTPEERALRDQFFKDMQARRAQRGLPNSPRFP